MARRAFGAMLLDEADDRVQDHDHEDRPGIDHRRVDALDHVGPVEDERLVALALQPPVVLLGQVELLEGRAHAAVEDDDLTADCVEEIAHGM